MFEKIKQFFANSWKKLALSAGTGVAVFLLLKFAVSSLLSLTAVAVAGGLAAAYLVYTRVALWEVRKLADKIGVKLDL